jgi:tRNA dimethylallyltransferase
VLTNTGRGLADWQAETPPPLIGADQATRTVLMADRDWLAERIARRFDQMLDQGALDEVRAMLPVWDPAAQWARAIGAPELIAHLQGAMSLDEARERAVIATRQYAKSQRIWFRGRMKTWQAHPVG